MERKETNTMACCHPHLAFLIPCVWSDQCFMLMTLRLHWKTFLIIYTIIWVVKRAFFPVLLFLSVFGSGLCPKAVWMFWQPPHFLSEIFFLVIHVDIWRGILARSMRVTENMSLLPWIIYSGLMEKRLKNLRGF